MSKDATQPNHPTPLLIFYLDTDNQNFYFKILTKPSLVHHFSTYLLFVQAFPTPSSNKSSFTFLYVKRKTVTKSSSTKAGNTSRFIWRVLHGAWRSAILNGIVKSAPSLHSKISLGEGNANWRKQLGQHASPFIAQ